MRLTSARVLGIAVLQAICIHSHQKSYAETLGEIKAPCTLTPGDVSGLRSCDSVLKSPTGTLTLLKKRVADYLKKIYFEGVDPNPMDPRESASFGPTFCNLVRGPFNPVSEKATNQAGKSCGNPLKVVLTNRGRTITFDSSAQGGLPLEEGYMRGSYAAAISCFHEGVARQIENERRIVPHPSCQSLAGDVSQLSKKADEILASLKNNLKGQANLGDIVNCVSPSSNSDDPKKQVDVGPLRQSAQQLCAARLAIESAFTQLAACEVFARAGAAYKNVIALPSARQAESRPIMNAMIDECGRGCDSPLPSPIPGQEARQEQTVIAAANDCANRCYVSKIPDYLRRRYETLWPSNPSGVNSCRETRP